MSKMLIKIVLTPVFLLLVLAVFIVAYPIHVADKLLAKLMYHTVQMALWVIDW